MSELTPPLTRAQIQELLGRSEQRLRESEERIARRQVAFEAHLGRETAARAEISEACRTEWARIGAAYRVKLAELDDQERREWSALAQEKVEVDRKLAAIWDEELLVRGEADLAVIHRRHGELRARRVAVCDAYYPRVLGHAPKWRQARLDLYAEQRAEQDACELKHERLAAEVAAALNDEWRATSASMLSVS